MRTVKFLIGGAPSELHGPYGGGGGLQNVLCHHLTGRSLFVLFIPGFEEEYLVLET